MRVRAKTAYRILAATVVIGGIWLAVAPHLLAAPSSAILNALEPDVIAEENGCTGRLAAENALPSSVPARTKVNNSGPYAFTNWITPAGQPTVRTITVGAGTTSLPLQLNQMEFICAIIVHNNANSSFITDGSSIVTTGNFPDDRAPNPDSGTDGASKEQDNTKINSATATVNGVATPVAAPAGGWTYLSATRDNNSRYWLANNIPFTYTPTAALTQSETVTINFNVTSIASFHTNPTTTQCTSQATGALINVAPTNFAPCTTSNISVSFQINVQDEPYFSVTGGDAVAGLTFDSGSACTQLNSATAAGKAAIIRSWNYDKDSYYGAGTQDAALALGQVSSFVTGLNPNALSTAVSALQTSLSGHPYDLSFADMSPAGGVLVDPPQADYGGGLGSFGGCMQDYFGENYNPAGASTATAVNLSSFTNSGTYSYKNDISLSGTLPAGLKVTLVVNGDVTITGNTAFQPYTLATLPSLNVYALRNIHVQGGVGAASVNNIHGFYVAQQGVFATCYVGGAETSLYGNCNQKLIVNGAVAANMIHLDRSYGTLASNSGPAESFQYGPEVWAAQGALCGGALGGCINMTHGYAAITSLPPIL